MGFPFFLFYLYLCISECYCVFSHGLYRTSIHFRRRLVDRFEYITNPLLLFPSLLPCSVSLRVFVRLSPLSDLETKSHRPPISCDTPRPPTSPPSSSPPTRRRKLIYLFPYMRFLLYYIRKKDERFFNMR